MASRPVAKADRTRLGSTTLYCLAVKAMVSVSERTVENHTNLLAKLPKQTDCYSIPRRMAFKVLINAKAALF